MEKKIVVNDGNVRYVVRAEIKRIGNKADLNHIDVSGVTDMWSLFNSSNFNGDISKWDVSNVENMGEMFKNSRFNGDISKWNVSNVKYMHGMFQNSKFNQDISNWNVGNVMDMIFMFENSDFNQDISNWDVGNVEIMGSMFRNSKFNQDISKWDVENVRDMSFMFQYSQFNQNIDMWNYNFKAVKKTSWQFDLLTTGSYTLIEKYIKALENKKFDLAERIKFKMKGIRFNYRYKYIEESKHLVTLDSKLLKEFKEYLWKRK